MKTIRCFQAAGSEEHFMQMKRDCLTSVELCTLLSASHINGGFSSHLKENNNPPCSGHDARSNAMFSILTSQPEHEQSAAVASRARPESDQQSTAGRSAARLCAVPPPRVPRMKTCQRKVSQRNMDRVPAAESLCAPHMR